jgi:small-conductance mechanosensitive channel
MQTTVSTTIESFGTLLLRLLAALAVLLIGWLIARWLAGLVGKLLKRLRIDERAAKAAGDEKVPKVEESLTKIVFYILMIVVLIAFFQVLGLTLITEPLNAFLGSISAYVP